MTLGSLHLGSNLGSDFVAVGQGEVNTIINLSEPLSCKIRVNSDSQVWQLNEFYNKDRPWNQLGGDQNYLSTME